MEMPDRERIDRFTLVECVGRGGMGRVYRARDERLQRDVAIKVLTSGREDDPVAVERFAREARATSRLDHPNLCRVFENGEVDGFPFLVMQFVAGQTLERRLRLASEGVDTVIPGAATPVNEDDERIPREAEIDAVASLFETIARAVHHAHENGLVHRDLKPANVMITPDGQPVVLDFGLAHDRTAELRLTATRDGLGTPQYMAPEQVDVERGPVDERTDVHALGLSLYESLTLWSPYTGATLHAVAHAILHTRPLPVRWRNPCVSQDLAVVVETAMHKEPSLRYRDAASLAEDLRRVRARLPILARRPTRWRRLTLWTRRNPVLAGFVALLTASLVVSVLALVDANSSRRSQASTLQQFDRLSIRQRLGQAEDAAQQLYPAWPDRLPALEQWVREHGEPVAARLDTLKAAVADVERGLAANDRAVGVDRDSQVMLLRLLQSTLPELERFAHHEFGALSDVRRRIDWARTTEARTLRHPDWDAAVRRVRELPVYAGVDLRPQLDLVPLGEDPRSGLLEFLHLPSHADGAPMPMRGADGALAIDESTGIVLVLLPGGDFTMGAQRSDPAGSRYDPEAEPDEKLARVRLAPFFFGKFEVTQAQWERLVHERPSLYGPNIEPFDVEASDGRKVTFERPTLLHPVEQVAWWQAQDAMAHQGMTLPTEAQWEYACRAGSDTVYAMGDDEASLEGFGNLPDRRAMVFSARTFPYFCAWDDGHAATAPVGRFRANRFGLHDVHGNVYEWCLDAQLPVDRFAALRDGDGLRLEDGASEEQRMLRCYRGGNFQMPPVETRCANRMRMHQNAAGDQVGLRAARALRS